MTMKRAHSGWRSNARSGSTGTWLFPPSTSPASPSSSSPAIFTYPPNGIHEIQYSVSPRRHATIGRPIVAWRRGETEYWISWIPFGGYVKMAGLEEEGLAGEVEGGKSHVPVDPERAFDRQPLWARFIVIVAGVTMNAVFAVVVYAGLAYTGTLEPNNVATTQVDSVIASE